MSAKSTACPKSTMSLLTDHVFLEDFFIWSAIRNPISVTDIKMSSKYAITIPAFACFEASIVNGFPQLNDSRGKMQNNVVKCIKMPQPKRLTYWYNGK